MASCNISNNNVSSGGDHAGRLLQRLALYDEKCSTLLQKAYEYAKEEEESLDQQRQRELGDNTVPVLPSTPPPVHDQAGESSDDDDDDDDDEFPAHDSSDDENGTDSDSSSVGSRLENGNQLATVAEEETEVVDLPIDPVAESLPTNDTSPAPTEPLGGPKKKRPPSNKQQKRQAQIVKQHLGNIIRSNFPLPSGSVPTDTEAVAVAMDERYQLRIPASLLSKSELRASTSLGQVHSLLTLSQALLQEKSVVVLLLQSGRFAGGVFQRGKCVLHRALQQYTVRKGQGKAQSSQDQKRRPKSVGSQLRRSGEQALKEDVRETLQDWKGHIADAAIVLVSCPKTSRATLFGSNDEIASISTAGANVFLLSKDDERIRKVPFDVGRPTFENVRVVHEVLMDVEVRASPSMETKSEGGQHETYEKQESTIATPFQEPDVAAKLAAQLAIDLPLAPIHEACRDGNLTALLDLVKTIEPGSADINQPAGYDCMTPLHFAAESTSNVDPVTAAACVSTLLIQSYADPCIVDARGRPAYFLASHDKVREAFRKSRAILGEDFCDWDGEAKVGPPLTDEDFAARKEKEAEKKRRKKARQKEKKEKEKSQSREMEERRKAEEEAQQQAEAAKRVRDGLAPKATGANVCDYCQKVCKGKKRNQMFQRLEYKYCSSDCVNNHKRELMAAAALTRFGG